MSELNLKNLCKPTPLGICRPRSIVGGGSMAETSDSPPEQNPQPQITEATSEFDHKTMRTTKPGVKRLTMSVTVLLSFIIGFPLIWKSIEIYRAPLPFDRIDSFSSQIESNPLLFPCRFRAIFVGFDFRVSNGEVGEAIRKKMSELSPSASRCGCGGNYSVSAVLDYAADCARAGNSEAMYAEVNAVDFGGKLRGSDEDSDEFVKSLVNVYGEEKVYSVVVVNGEEEVRTVVGKYRHEWILGRVSEEETVLRVAEIFAELFVNGGNEEGSIRGEFMPVGADGRIVLSLSLLNADPRDWIHDWDFREIDEVLLQPVIEALQPIANITVESQVLYHTPKSSFSYWDDKYGSHIFSTKNLPFFVNSNEWHLDTSVVAGGRSKVLQLVPQKFFNVAQTNSYNFCILRYSNHDFFGNMAITTSWQILGSKYITSSEEVEIAENHMQNLIREATFETNKLYAMGEFNLSCEKRYGFVQCSRALTIKQCSQCLVAMLDKVPKCCGTKTGWQVLAPSCLIKYDDFKFYQIVDQPSSPLPNIQAKQGGSSKSKTLIIITIVTVLVAGALALLSCCIYYLWRRHQLNKVGLLSEDSLNADLLTIPLIWI